MEIVLIEDYLIYQKRKHSGSSHARYYKQDQANVFRQPLGIAVGALGDSARGTQARTTNKHKEQRDLSQTQHQSKASPCSVTQGDGMSSSTVRTNDPLPLLNTLSQKSVPRTSQSMCVFPPRLALCDGWPECRRADAQSLGLNSHVDFSLRLHQMELLHTVRKCKPLIIL